ncbi:MAG: DNA polymerase III subunit beta [Patescibacteria group bacterium]
MKTKVKKQVLLNKLIIASRFAANRPGLSDILQGVLFQGDGKTLEIISTNLSSYYKTSIPFISGQNVRAVIDIKRVVEFLGLLEKEDVDIEIEERSIRLTQDKTTGTFPLTKKEDFPVPPQIQANGQDINPSFFLKNLPLVLFSASRDETRPALNGVNFVDMEDSLGIVSTDGFRMSLLKIKKENDFPSTLIPSGFLSELLKHMKTEEPITYIFSIEEKTVLFKIGEDSFYTRLIEGEFPPFEKVIPAEKKTTVVVDSSELQTKIKLVSIFARDASNIVVCEFGKRGLILRPKTEGGKENRTHLDIEIEGEEQTIAFNSRFILDFLNNTPEKTTEIELLRADAPVVFKMKGRKDFIHIIMPVRIQE